MTVGRPAAEALIQPLAWEPPCAVGVALEKINRPKNKKKQKKQKQKETHRYRKHVSYLWGERKGRGQERPREAATKDRVATGRKKERGSHIQRAKVI